jgi:carbamate kinase
MRIVIALGGNALLHREQALTAENQRHNVKIAAEALAPIAREHQLVITHGNGPQVGLLALQDSAYKEEVHYPGNEQPATRQSTLCNAADANRG